jgi:hypothetical protein
MKVFVLCEGFAEDYYSGGESIIGVYANRDDALAEAIKRLPKVAKSPDAEEWYFPKQPATESWLSLQEWEVQ